MTANHPGIDALATDLGELAWISDQLFALEGRWSAQATSDAAAIHWGTHSRHHGWHGALWRDLLPDSPSLDAGARVTATPGWAEAMVICAALETDVARVAALSRVLLPRLVAMLDEFGARVGGPGDDVIGRSLRFVRADVLDDLAGGCAIFATVVGSETDRVIAEGVVADLDRVFVER